MPIQFERQSLYEEVWSEPLTRLGKKYGLSDNCVRKICIALNIPLPKTGHWAKIAAGHQIPRTPLPKNSKITVYVSNPKPAEPLSQEKTEDAIWLEQQESFEADPINHIVVELQPKKFHPLLLETRSRLIEKAKESTKLIIEARKEANRPRGKVWEPNINSASLSYFEQRGQILDLYKRDMPFRFTPLTYERGLAIANALFYSAEKRGFEIIKAKDTNNLCIKIDGGEVNIRMSEKLRDETVNPKNLSDIDRLVSRTKIKAPTGILRFHLSAAGTMSETEIGDFDDKSLQDNLNLVFCKIYKLVIRSKAKHREWAERNRKYAEENRQREEREKIRLEALRFQEIESQKRKDLLKEANDWQSAELIYKYIAHFDELGNFQGNESFLEWKKWALKVANELNPTFIKYLSKIQSR
jgi:hypothetical protein